ncbi:hypothetical protein OG301_26655 [Streptomyces platensis]|uniref:hypothetical protein n=1 Tax=Streptomyces platensis TaxID=58346 RepID=UPI002ED4AB98|nr:hypothetical protein OG301_26655 [Streptomyces platensis]
MNRRAPVLAVAAAAAGLSLTACDPGRECLDYDTHVVSTTHFVNGKVIPGTSVATVCVEYAPLKKEAPTDSSR